MLPYLLRPWIDSAVMVILITSWAASCSVTSSLMTLSRSLNSNRVFNLLDEVFFPHSKDY
jgi:hypothetical protein